jgi:uncharacterized DUF497 family protein
MIAAAGIIAGEQRYEAVGPTKSGRVLVVVFTLRGESYRPITAYPADGWRMRLFLQTIEDADE